MDRPKEGPFTIAAAIATLAALLLTLVGALLSPARLVLGGVLIGFSLAAGGALTYLGRLRRDPERLQHKPPALLTPLLPLLGLGLGLFLLVAPTFMTLPGDARSSESRQAGTPIPTSAPSPTTASTTSPVPSPSTPTTPSALPASPGAAPTGAPSAAGVYYDGRIRLADNIGSDLDHQPPTSATGSQDLGLTTPSAGLTIQNLGNTVLALWTNQNAPTPQDCVIQVSTQSQTGVPAQVGTRFCVETNSSHVAYARVVTVEQDSPHTVQLDVTVWNRPP